VSGQGFKVCIIDIAQYRRFTAEYPFIDGVCGALVPEIQGWVYVFALHILFSGREGVIEPPVQGFYALEICPALFFGKGIGPEADEAKDHIEYGSAVFFHGQTLAEKGLGDFVEIPNSTARDEIVYIPGIIIIHGIVDLVVDIHGVDKIRIFILFVFLKERNRVLNILFKPFRR
jgi:hypothetical protein